MDNNAAKHYWERQIMNASPVERIILSYDGAIKFLLKGRKAIEDGNIQERFNNVQRASDVINYLAATLDLEKGGEIAVNLARFYNYLISRLVTVHIKNDVSIIDEVIGHLKEMRASWVKISNGEAESIAKDSQENQGEGDVKKTSEQSDNDSSNDEVRPISVNASV